MQSTVGDEFAELPDDGLLPLAVALPLAGVKPIEGEGEGAEELPLSVASIVHDPYNMDE